MLTCDQRRPVTAQFFGNQGKFRPGVVNERQIVHMKWMFFQRNEMQVSAALRIILPGQPSGQKIQAKTKPSLQNGEAWPSLPTLRKLVTGDKHVTCLSVPPCRRVVDILDGRPRRRLHLKRPSILVADRFFPSDLFSLDRRMVLGLASDKDSTVSHAAIMARSMGIPAVVQLGEGASAMAAGRRAILDADSGTLVVEPDGAQIAQADCKIALSRLHGAPPDPAGPSAPWSSTTNTEPPASPPPNALRSAGSATCPTTPADAASSCPSSTTPPAPAASASSPQ